ncbi:MAG: hypothetical protein ACUVXI_07090 [bacterium]
MKGNKWILLPLLVIFTCLAIQAQPQSERKEIGRLISVLGVVEIRREGDSVWDRVSVGADIFGGDRLRTGRNSRAVIILSTDEQMVVHPDSEIAFDKLISATKGVAPEVKRMFGGAWSAIKNKFASASATQTRLSAVGAVRAAKRVSTMGEKVLPPALIRPAHTKIITKNPTFVWECFAEGAKFNIRLFERGKQIWEWRGLATKEVTLPFWPFAPWLEGGKTYEWEIEAVRGEESAMSPRVPFTILSDDEAESVRGLASTMSGDDVASYIVLGSFYEDKELYLEAEAVYLRAIEGNPDSAVLHSALSDLYSKLGLSDKAFEEFKKAEELMKNE